MSRRDGLDAALVRDWLATALRVAEETSSLVDSLNEFPVPDSDTGTNVALTLRSACEALDRLPAGLDVAQASRAAADGAVRGARGNSGLLISQALTALADECSELPDPALLRPVELVHALERIAQTTWHAVSRPVPGTLLTVARDAAVGARRALEDSSPAAPASTALITSSAAFSAQESVVETAGLGHGPVDAGGAALMLLLTTLADTAARRAPRRTDARAASAGERDVASEEPSCTPVARQMLAELAAGGAHAGSGATGELSTGEFEVMYLLEATADQASDLRRQLEGLGDSVGVVGTPDALGVGMFQVHVHTDTPRAALPRAGRARQVCVHHLHPTALASAAPWEADDPPLGAAGDERVVSMEGFVARRAQRQAQERDRASREHPSRAGEGPGPAQAPGPGPRPARGTGVVACTRAPGLIEQLARTGAVVVLDPERDGILRAVGDLAADHVVVLPCDAAALASAHDAARLVSARSTAGPVRGVGEARRATVPSAAAPVQLLVCDTDDDAQVLAAAVSVAGQGTTTDSSSLLHRASLAAVGVRTTALSGPDAEADALAAALAQLLRPEDELVTVIVGRGADPDVASLARTAIARYAEQVLGDADAIEVVVHAGGQTVPDVLVAVE